MPGIALSRITCWQTANGEARLHISLSPAPEDRLTDGRLAELAGNVICRRWGMANQPYITYKHADTHNTHIHIVSVCVDEQGKKISDAYEHRRSMTACRELERISVCETGGCGKGGIKSGTKKVDASREMSAIR